ncbi:MAG: hypothetical protein ABSF53_21895, partial [Terracidiphilus sp.]
VIGAVNRLLSRQNLESHVSGKMRHCSAILIAEERLAQIEPSFFNFEHLRRPSTGNRNSSISGPGSTGHRANRGSI